MEKILTISVAAYNAEKDIARCLDSMVNTSIANQLDIVVVNDGSNDNTLYIAEDYEKKYPGIVRVINKKNGGHGSTINASIKVAEGKYYKIVDSDDWVDAEGIEKLVSELKLTNVDLVLNPYHEINAKTLQRNNLVKPFTTKINIGKVYVTNNVEDIVIYMHSTTFKTSIVKKMGPIIDEKCFYVDMEYTVFPLKYVDTYICLGFPVYQYLLGTTSQSMNKNSLISRRDQHLRVTKRIIDYYEDNKESMNQGIREMVLRRVRLALLNQYKIYFNLSGKVSKKELVSFDNWVRERSSDVYVGPEGRFMGIVRMNRRTRFFIFNAIVKAMKITHMEPEL